VRAGQGEIVTEILDKEHPGFDVRSALNAVDAQRDRHVHARTSPS